MLTPSKLQPCFLKQLLKRPTELKELEIMYSIAICICISWYNKSCWFPVKNADVNELKGCHVIYITFWIFFRKGIIVSSLYDMFTKFHHCTTCTTDFREVWLFHSLHRKQLRKGPSWIRLIIYSLFLLLILLLLLLLMLLIHFLVRQRT